MDTLKTSMGSDKFIASSRFEDMLY